MDNGILAMLAMACIYCNANEYHHVNLGPETFIMIDQEKNLGKTYAKSAYLAGVSGGYEYLEPNNFYVGAEVKYLIGGMTVTDNWYVPRGDVKMGYFRYAGRFSRELGLVHKSIEGRIGYNFLAFRDLMITPYIGVGDKYTRAVSSDSGFGLRMSRESLYVVHGLRAEYVMADSVHFGVNFKEYVTMRGEARSNVSPSYLNPMMAAHEISFPWAIRFHGESESFVVKLEPYFRKDNVNSMELTIGSTLQISCDF